MGQERVDDRVLVEPVPASAAKSAAPAGMLNSKLIAAIAVISLRIVFGSARTRPISLRSVWGSPRGVVVLEHQLRARRDQRATPSGGARRHPGAYPARKSPSARRGCRAGSRRRPGDGPPSFPRPHLRGPDPDVLLELRVNHEFLVAHRPVGGDLDLLGQGDDQVGRGDAPALDVVPGSGTSRGSPSGDPAATQAAIVRFSSAPRRASLENVPYSGLACQGASGRPAPPRRSSRPSRRPAGTSPARTARSPPRGGRRRSGRGGCGRPASST